MTASFLIRPLSLVVLAAVAANAAETSSHTTSSIEVILGSLGGLVLSVIQLIVGFTLAAFSITKGLELVGKLLGGLDIWAQIKNKNIAVALLAGAVVYSYATVIGGGIASMNNAIALMATGGWTSGLVALFSGGVNLVVAIALASMAITIVFTIMDKLTKDIDEKKELADGNIAVGVVYCGILLAVSSLIGAGVQSIGSGIFVVVTAVLKVAGIG